MASLFMIGSTAETLTSLDELATPLPDPQWAFNEYKEMVKLGSLGVRGLGPQNVLWSFPMLETAQIAQLETFNTGEPLYIQTLKRDDTEAVFQVRMNWVEPSQDGEHKAGFQGWRMGLDIEMIILSEVGGS